MNKLFLAAAILSLSSAALADQTGAYVAGNLGLTTFDDDDIDFDSSLSYGVAAGYRWAYVSLEAGYYATETEVELFDTDFDVDLSVLYIMPKVHYPINETTDVFFGIGYADFEVDIEGIDESQNSEIYELGVTYRMDNWAITGSWLHLGDDVNNFGVKGSLFF